MRVSQSMAPPRPPLPLPLPEAEEEEEDEEEEDEDENRKDEDDARPAVAAPQPTGCPSAPSSLSSASEQRTAVCQFLKARRLGSWIVRYLPCSGPPLAVRVSSWWLGASLDGREGGREGGREKRREEERWEGKWVRGWVLRRRRR